MPKKRESVYWEATSAIWSAAKSKLSQLRDPRYAALLLIEFFLTMLVVAGMALYIDGRFNQLDWPLNFFVFAAIVFAAIHFSNCMRPFRASRKGAIKRASSLKTIALEFIIFLIVLISAWVYTDKSINILPYPANLLFFLLALSVPLYFYIGEKFISHAA